MPDPNDVPEYPREVRAGLASLLNDSPPGAWVELGLCPGPYGCMFETEAEAIGAGARENFCDGCRVIISYRPA